MAKKEKKEGISQASKSKKISFFSAILVVMGSSIGAGIFFKSKSVKFINISNLLLNHSSFFGYCNGFSIDWNFICT